jgi:hypothetical protein
MSAAQADNVTVTGIPGPQFLIVNASGSVTGDITGTAQTIGASNAVSGDTVVLTGDVGNFAAGVKAVMNLGLGAKNPVTTLTGAGLNGSNEGAPTFSINAISGNAAFSNNVEATSASIGTGGLSVTGNTTTNGITNTGDITTDTLHVNGASITNGINNTGALNQNGVATFTNTASSNPNQGSTTVNGAFANLSSIQGSITLDATQDPIITVTNGTSTTQIHNGTIISTVSGAGSTNINGGFVQVDGTYTGGVGGLNAGNAAVVIDGGQVTRNGAIVNGGFIANDGSTLNGGVTVNGPTQLNGSFAVTPGNNISMGNNVVHDVAAPVAGTDAANKAYVDNVAGGVFNRLNAKTQDLGAGIAVASSLSTPDRTGNQTWAVAVNWGNFEGFNAISGSAIAAIAHDTFFAGDMISLGGSVGVSTDRNQVAGRVSLQIAGGGYSPLK